MSLKFLLLMSGQACCAGGLVFTLATAPACAQNQRPTEVSGSEGSEEKSDLVVTAQRREQSLQDVPISLTVISAQTLDRSSIDAGDMLPRVAPALTFTTGAIPSFATFNNRGIGSYVYRIGIQPAVSLVVDGVPLARTSEFAGELGDVQRVEVLSGPQGTQFGRNATGGVINITRHAPMDTFAGSVSGELTAGEHGDLESDVRAMVNLPLRPDTRLRLFAFNRQNDDFIRNLNPDAPDAGKHHVYGAQGKLAVDLAPDLELILSGDYQHDFSRNGSASILVPLQSYQQPLIPDVTAVQTALLRGTVGRPFEIDTYLPFSASQESGGGALDLSWHASRSLTIRSITSYRTAGLDAISPIYNVSPYDPRGFDLLSLRTSALNPSPYSRVTRWHYVTQGTRAEFTSRLVDLVAGAFYSRLRETELAENPTYTSARALGAPDAIGTPDGPTAAFPFYYFNNLTVASDVGSSIAGFADVTLHPTSRLDVFGGYRLSYERLRYTYFQQRYSAYPIQPGVNFDPATWTPTLPPVARAFAGRKSETLWSGRTGASFAVAPSAKAYATVSRGYIGSGVDLGNGSTGSPGNPGAAFLRPSVTVNYETGVKAQLLDNRVLLNLAIFKADTRDVQVTGTVPGTNINIVQNAGDVHAKGVELNAQAQVSRPLLFEGGLSYLDARIRNLNQLCYPGQGIEQGCTGTTQSVAGKPAINAPRLKFNVAATYVLEMPSQPFDLFLRANYRHQSRVWFQLDHDPFATQASYGVLDLAVGLTSKDHQFELRMFVSNVGNTFYCENMVSGPYFRQGCQSTSIDAQRRFGISARRSL